MLNGSQFTKQKVDEVIAPTYLSLFNYFSQADNISAYSAFFKSFTLTVPPG